VRIGASAGEDGARDLTGDKAVTVIEKEFVSILEQEPSNHGSEPVFRFEIAIRFSTQTVV